MRRRMQNVLEAGMVGLFVTCPRKKEHQCASEMLELLNEKLTKLYPQLSDSEEVDEEKNDIETSIKSELQRIKSGRKGLLRPIRLDIDCVLFLQTLPPLDPVQLVQSICEDLQSTKSNHIKWPQRIMPITASTSASIENLRALSVKVLAPYFHVEGCGTQKYAIRPTLRNHSTMNRDDIIKVVASVVGKGHSVDLNNYDLLIVVEVFKNFAGMSVVCNFRQFKGFNLSEICKGTTSGG